MQRLLQLEIAILSFSKTEAIINGDYYFWQFFFPKQARCLSSDLKSFESCKMCLMLSILFALIIFISVLLSYLRRWFFFKDFHTSNEETLFTLPLAYFLYHCVQYHFTGLCSWCVLHVCFLTVCPTFSLGFASSSYAPGVHLKCYVVKLLICTV